MHHTFIDHLVPDGLDSLVLEPGSATVLTVRRAPANPAQAGPPPPLWLAGEVDLVTAADLANHVRTALPDEPTDPVVLDLSRVTFMDLSGLRMLLRLQTELSAHGTRLVLRAPSPPVRLLLRAVRPWATLLVHPGPSPHDPPHDEKLDR